MSAEHAGGLRALAAAIGAGEVSPVAAVEEALDRIERFDPDVHAFSLVLREPALRAAREREVERAQGRLRGSLHGVPVAVKDIVDIAGHRTSCSSEVTYDHVATETADVVDRLEGAGAVVVGKTHTHEFALGVLTPHARNPWDLARSPGGSSGGSGAAVAAGLVTAAIGTDTGGSIRGPAAHCGVAGLKPTFGLVPTRGVTPCSWSLDHVGPLAANVADCGVMLSAIAAPEADGRSRDLLRGLGRGPAGIRVGVPANHYFDDIEPAVHDAVMSAIALLEGAGARTEPVSFELAPAYMPTLFCIITPEAADFHRSRMETRGSAYTDQVRGLIEMGREVRAESYIHALRVRARIQQEWREVLQRVDVVVAPTHPATAPMRESMYDPIAWPSGAIEPPDLTYSRLTGPANLTGLPAMSVPCGKGPDGMPIGLQVIGRPYEEHLVLQVAEAVEQLVEPIGHPAVYAAVTN